MNSRFYVVIAGLAAITIFAYLVGAPESGGGLGFDRMRASC